MWASTLVSPFSGDLGFKVWSLGFLGQSRLLWDFRRLGVQVLGFKVLAC